MLVINWIGKKNKLFNWKKEYCIGIGLICNDRNCFLGIWIKNSGLIFFVKFWIVFDSFLLI